MEFRSRKNPLRNTTSNAKYFFDENTNFRRMQSITPDIAKTKYKKALFLIRKGETTSASVNYCFICSREYSAERASMILYSPSLITCSNCNRMFYDHCDVTNYDLYKNKVEIVDGTVELKKRVDYSNYSGSKDKVRDFQAGIIYAIIVILLILSSLIIYEQI